jgi:hypothetical protein
LTKYIIVTKNRTIPPMIARKTPKFVKIKYKIPINIAILINEAKKFIYKNTFFKKFWHYTISRLIIIFLYNIPFKGFI